MSGVSPKIRTEKLKMKDDVSREKLFGKMREVANMTDVNDFWFKDYNLRGNALRIKGKRALHEINVVLNDYNIEAAFPDDNSSIDMTDDEVRTYFKDLINAVNNYIDILKTSTGLKITPKGFFDSFVTINDQLTGITVNGGKVFTGNLAAHSVFKNINKLNPVIQKW
ncbi:MAG: hypothetical protein U0354_14815 [Candidatus Sericytochromatia bacterium]